MVRAAKELGLKAKQFGGSMVGLQTTSIKTQLGPLLNGIVAFDFWLPAPSMHFQRQHSIPVLGLYSIRIDLNRNRHRSIKLPGQPLSTMETGFLRIVDCLSASDAQRVVLYLDFQIRLLDAREFDENHEVFALLEYIDRRIRSDAAWARI
jgi:hypothetical protein